MKYRWCPTKQSITLSNGIMHVNITIFTKNRQCLFVDIVGETMLLGVYGEIAESEIMSKQAGAASGAPTETQVTIGNVVRGLLSPNRMQNLVFM